MLLRLLAVPALILVLADTAGAETSFGVRGGFYAEAGEPFAGAEVVAGLSDRIAIVPNVEVLLVDEGHHVVGSLDLQYDLSCTCSPDTIVYAGAGLAVISRELGDVSTRDAGLNLLGGAGVKLGGVTPYVQLRATIRDPAELSIGVGLRF